MKKINLLDDKDFNELVKKLWKDKFFILIITAIFSLLFYFFSPVFIKKIKTQIVIQNPPAHLFVEYDKFYKLYVGTAQSSLHDKELLNSFISDLRFNILFNGNLEKFLEQSKDFQNSDFLKKDLNKNNYRKHFKITTNNENKYTLIYPEGLNGQALLTAYIEYTKSITLNQSKNKLKNALKEIYSSIISDLEISKKIQSSPLQSQNNLESFYDAKILNNRVIVLNSLIERLDKKSFDYDIVLVSPSYHSDESSILNLYPFLGILLAFFLAALTVIFRDKIKRK